MQNRRMMDRKVRLYGYRLVPYNGNPNNYWEHKSFGNSSLFSSFYNYLCLFLTDGQFRNLLALSLLQK